MCRRSDSSLQVARLKLPDCVIRGIKATNQLGDENMAVQAGSDVHAG